MEVKNSLSSSKAGIGWLLKMAWRDGKASKRKLVLFMASIVLGIAAVVSIQSFGDNLTENIALQSKELMGADYLLDSNRPANERVQAIMDSLGGPFAQEVNFASMVSFPKNGDTKLAQVKGLLGGFPYYGTLDTEPAGAGAYYQERGAALVDATLMLQYKLKPGDSIKVGNSTLPIAGSLKAVPGRSAISSTVAPAVFIPYRYLAETGLIQQGSRVEYQYYFLASRDLNTPDIDSEALHEQLDDVLAQEDYDLDTHLDTSRSIGRSWGNFGKFLNLVAFIALLLGCVGIASAIHIYMKEKLKSVAVLKCLGASRKQTFFIFLIQIAVLGFLGGIVGTLVGVGLQQLSPLLLKDLLPLDVQISLSLQPIIMGLLLGVLIAVFVCLTPFIGNLVCFPFTSPKSGQWGT